MIASFPLGQVVAPPGALAALKRSEVASRFLTPHASGDLANSSPRGCRRERVRYGSRVSVSEQFSRIDRADGWADAIYVASLNIPPVYTPHFVPEVSCAP